MSYSKKLQDPRWQQVRQRVLARDRNRCVNDPKHRMPLEVHHLRYTDGCEPWEYPLDNFVTLCRDCHVAAHEEQLNNPRPRRVQGGFYAWHQIQGLVGHPPRGYLTEVGGRIVCGCFQLALNPDAPDIVLPGTRKDWLDKATLFQKQSAEGASGAVPIFVKGEGLPWEYVGRYRVEAITRNHSEIRIHQERAKRRDIGLVMFLRSG
jgi:hypothetical protein